MNQEFTKVLIDMGDVSLRSLTSLIVLFLLTRLMGKKQISQLTFFDYVVGITIGSIAAEMATDTNSTYFHTMIGIVVYAVVALLISVVTNKSIFARRFFTGHTYLLINKGKIMEKDLKNVHYDVNDLLSEARNAGYFNISDIEYALLETNGKISFLPKSEKRPVTPEDMNLPTEPATLFSNLIIDGKIMKNNLKTTGLNEAWLRQELKKQNYSSVREIVLAAVDSKNQLSVYPMTHREAKKTPID